ncbi:extensin family protein [Sphingomonas japonica]|uniref:Extensin-like C-terminal domain-containing protein n=1 Tax=Sphingomonas japonica TaxID=511662 RepID=A0ABX0TYL7_9SPHN|nr:extensin family protein [Sphingomonas japonica]NIJ23408.1 hypothetical protein [Sphingomonas japonica]
MRTRTCISAILALPLLLSGCLFGGSDRDERPARVTPRASGPVSLPSRPSAETRQCYADLGRDRIEYRTLPDRDYGGGCLVIGAVQLLDIGVPVANLKSMRCPLARAFTGWVRGGVAPAALQMLGSELVRVESMGTYSCRGIVGGGAGSAGRISQHGLANAVDVAVFVLRDGRRVSIEDGWNGSPQERAFLRTIRASACKRFTTVLSPDYNSAHYNHLHLDLGGKAFCR